MKRRTLLSLTAAGLVTPSALVLAGEGNRVAYSREAYEQALASGGPLLLDFYASW